MQKEENRLNININLQDWRKVEDELPTQSSLILAYDDEDKSFPFALFKKYCFVANFIPKKYRVKKRRRTCLQLSNYRIVFFTHWIPFAKLELPGSIQKDRR